MKALKLFKNDNNKSIIWNDEYIEPIDDDDLKNDQRNEVNENLDPKDLQMKIDAKKQSLEIKNLEILKLYAQKNIMEKLIERNKNEELNNKNIKFEDGNEKIHFPFLLVEFPDNKTNSVKNIFKISDFNRFKRK